MGTGEGAAEHYYSICYHDYAKLWSLQSVNSPAQEIMAPSLTLGVFYLLS